jgi:hypothetical protein
MDLPFVVEPLISMPNRIITLAWWFVAPGVFAFFLLQDDPSKGIMVVPLAIGAVAVVQFAEGAKLPRRYEITPESIKLVFGWPHSATFAFKDGLELKEGFEGGFWTLNACLSGEGTVTITRRASRWWQWKRAAISVANPEEFLAVAAKAMDRFERTSLNGFPPL